MKRDFKLSSVIIVELIAFVIAIILSGISNRVGESFKVLPFIINFLTSFIVIIFQFTIASALLINRNGSVSEYLDQINYMNKHILLVNLVLGFLVYIFNVLVGLLSAFIVIQAGLSKSLVTAGAIIFFAFIASILLSSLLAYSNFYLADQIGHEGIEEGIFKSIKNFLLVGKDLFKKTLIINLKYTLIPFIIYLGLAALLFTNSSPGMGSVLLLSLYALSIPVAIIVIGAYIQARLADNYLDYVGK